MERSGIHAVDSLRGVYVLVVDADADGRTLLATILRYCGAYVKEASSTREAFDLMAQMLPDVLVVDLATDTDDFWLIRQVRALKPDAGGMVRAIALGPRAREEMARSRGFDGYLAKPFDPWELCRLASSLLTA